MIKKFLAVSAMLLCSAVVVAAERFPETLNITYVKAPFNIQAIVMKNQGLLEKAFERDGVQVHWVPIKAGINQMQAMAAGRLDMAVAMNTSTILIANGAGNRIDIIDGVAKPAKLFSLMATKDIRNVTDLKGKKVAGPKGTVLHHLLIAALDANGMTEKDVELISMNLPASLATLSSGRAQAALLNAAGVDAAKQAGAHELVNAQGLVPVTLVLAARAEFAKDYPEVVKRVSRINREALRWARENPDQALTMATQELQITKQQAQDLFDKMGYFEKFTVSDVKDLEETQSFLVKHGLMQKSVDVQSLLGHVQP